MRNSIRKKQIFYFFVAVIIIFGSIVVTLAWLTEKTDSIENTFTTANISISLTETPNEDSNDEDTENDIWIGKMVPGTSITKDPIVTVKENSEACWLFVKAREDGGNVTVGSVNFGFDDFVKYKIAEGWSDVPDITNVYYREVNETHAENGISYEIIGNNQVSIPETVTRAMLDAVNGDDAPSLTFTAYAIQKEGFDNASDAWEEVQKLE